MNAPPASDVPLDLYDLIALPVSDISSEVAQLQNQFFLLNHVTYLFSNGHDHPDFPGLAKHKHLWLTTPPCQLASLPI
eukprot:scaffold243799_cov18-Tisochrysis_lutea.AAC.1